MNLKNFLRKRLRGVGYDAVDVRRFDRAMGAESSWSTHEKLVLYLIEHALSRTHHKPPTFLQIGANDGLKDNFTGGVLRREDVRIVLLEPDPYCASRLTRGVRSRGGPAGVRHESSRPSRTFHFRACVAGASRVCQVLSRFG